jgi:hypothetical protein
VALDGGIELLHSQVELVALALLPAPADEVEVDSAVALPRRVRVWFGEHVIAEYTAEPATALRYQAALTRRFASLRVTIELVAVADEQP